MVFTPVQKALQAGRDPDAADPSQHLGSNILLSTPHILLAKKKCFDHLKAVVQGRSVKASLTSAPLQCSNCLLHHYAQCNFSCQQQEHFARVEPSLCTTSFVCGCREPDQAAQLPHPKPGQDILVLAKPGQQDHTVLVARASCKR